MLTLPGWSVPLEKSFRGEPGRTTSPSLRRLAFEVLRKVGSGRFARISLERLFDSRSISEADRALLSEMVFGVIRRRKTLDRLIECASGRRLANIEPQGRLLLHLGTYQLLFLSKVPPYAAVNETVNVAKSIGGSHLARFANAVLRKVSNWRGTFSRDNRESTRTLPIEGDYSLLLPEDVFTDPGKDLLSYLSEAYSYPRWAVERWLRRFGKELTRTILREGNLPRPVFLRTNTIRTSPEYLRSRLEQGGCEVGETPYPEVFRTQALSAEVRLLLAQGLLSVQDVTQYRATRGLVLEKASGERFLDLCSSPGGKTTQIAEATQDRAEIVAVDRSKSRLKMVQENCQRLGIHSVQLLCSDAARLPRKFFAAFDRVLLDAPCSNTGVLSRRPEARWRLNSRFLRSLVVEQQRLFEAALRYARPGGLILYSTCSLEREENEERVEVLRRSHPERFDVVEQEIVLPGTLRGDGGFWTLMRKRS